MRSHSYRAAIAAAVALATMAAGPAKRPASGPATAPAAGPTIVRLTLHPMAVAGPPLQYQLLPPLADQHPGDAAYAWAEATGHLPAFDPGPDYWSQVDDQLDAPAAAFDPTRAAELVGRLPMDRIDAAARCEPARWDVDFRGHGVYTRLPYLNPLRAVTRVIGLRARLAAVRGDWPAAQQAMQTTFAAVRQLRDRPFLVTAFVQAGLARSAMDDGVQAWIAQPAAPNLYWPLSAMPSSFVDLYGVAETERAGLRFTDPPWIALALDDQLPPGEWQRVVTLVATVRHAREPASGKEVADVADRLRRTLDVPARAHLRTTGVPVDAAATMSADEAVGRYLLWQSTDVWDQMWKAWPLPFPQAVGPLRRTTAAFHAAAAEGNLLIDLRNPVAARYTLEAADQQLAALRVVEALRDHAARHGGRPPASLDDVADLPVPPDPVTGRPFDYRAQGTTATLTFSGPPDVSPLTGCRYELTFVTP